MINNISDIKTNVEYIILLTNDKRSFKKGRVTKITNSQNNTLAELNIDFYKKGKFDCSHHVDLCSIGIGESKKEAANNYGQFDYDGTLKTIVK